MKLTRKQKDAFKIILDLAGQSQLEFEGDLDLDKEADRQYKAFDTVEKTLKELGMRV